MDNDTKSDFSLEDKYRREEGTIILSGVQALVRLPLDQNRADKRSGLHTATLISGYRGSPLGGFDMALEANPRLLEEHGVTFISGVNEDLGATAVFGSQLANLYPLPKFDGVLGLWYGKAPGVDRSGDVFKHANFAGAGRYGGVLAVAGDDAFAKSSTIPSQSEAAFYDALMPVLYPGNVQEILDLGRFGIALSRYSGLWVGFKISTEVANAFGTVAVGAARAQSTNPQFEYRGEPWQARQYAMLMPPHSLEAEREVYSGRLEAAKSFARANRLNRITVATTGAWLGIAAAGKTYYDLREALAALGLDDAALTRHGIRLLKIGMLFPMEPTIVQEFAQGLEELFVIEEKRAFIELFIRDILYNQLERPRIVGKQDEQGRELVAAYGELDADMIARLLATRLGRRVESASIPRRMALLDDIHRRTPPSSLARPPYFCSGCPLNRSTLVPEGSLSGGGTGCHSMLHLFDRNTLDITQMGGEGVQWVGIAPFSKTPHIFQNLGDGTLFHSGWLAIRQAVAAGTTITYKILYNSVVAMTGGQDAAGAMPVAELTHGLAAEGIRQIVVVTDAPDRYAVGAGLALGVTVWHRDRLEEVQHMLRKVPGVTVLIYDQRCAAETRRLRRRGRLPEPAERLIINEAVCEGCGDCGVKSNCLSVHPVETEYGRKTQIHQGSCNKDYSCLLGDCPAFLSVALTGVAEIKSGTLYKVNRELPDPVPRVLSACNLYMTGIGGTGVVTANQILGTAALLDGKHVSGLDQTGLSQKGGPVISHLKISDAPLENSNRVTAGEADCYLGFDILTATQPDNLKRARADKTIAVVSVSQVPTGQMVTSTDVHFPDVAGLVEAINAVTRQPENVFADAVGLAEALFDNHMAANILLLGVAYQAGAIPVSATAIEQAIRLNGVAIEMNTQAFRAGRLFVVDRGALENIKRPRRPGAVTMFPPITREAQVLIDTSGATGELRRLLEVRVPELIDYQNAAYARAYVDEVTRVRAAEQRTMPEDTRLSEAVARYLFKLMAYKDEYEVARLHLNLDLAQALAEEAPGRAKVHYHLQPAFLRKLGVKNKIKVGRWLDFFYRVLVAARHVRGTVFDLFGYTRVRRTERALIREYQLLISGLLPGLAPDNYERAVKLATLPDLIRGYDAVKLRNVERFRNEVRALRY
jgi:indolepyruvate ferredoxin oxidoreductase